MPALRLQIHSNENGSRYRPADEEAGTNTLANLRATHRLGRIFGSMASALVSLKSSLLGILPGSEKIYEMKQNHYWIHGILERLSIVLSKCDERYPCMGLDILMSVAVKNGIIELIDSLRRANPALLWDVKDNKKNILANAIRHRQEKVFQFILGIQERQKENLIRHRDRDGTNILHISAELGPSSYLNRMSNPALQMQKELQWFKAVERIVPPICKKAENKDRMTAHELFNKKHRHLLIAGEQWARDTAHSFIFVVTLIITVTFAAAFTVPGGNDQNTGIPIFSKRPAFLVFIIADAISLVTSSCSLLIFIEIIRFRYGTKDFLKCMHNIFWGIFTLFFSVASMMLAFVSALSLILKEHQGAMVAASSLAIIPVLVLVKTLWSPFSDIIEGVRL